MPRQIASVLLALLPLLSAAPFTTAAESNELLDELLKQATKSPGVFRYDIGVTRKNTKIPCLITADDLNHNTSKTRVLIIAGIYGSINETKVSLEMIRWFYTSADAKPFRSKFALSAVPLVKTDALRTKKNGRQESEVDTAIGFPPRGTAYSDPGNPEWIYLWRWIGMHAPDVVVVLGPESQLIPLYPARSNRSLKRLQKEFGGIILPEGNDLVSQLAKQKPAGVGSIPALQMGAANSRQSLKSLLTAIQKSQFHALSPARRELQRRQKRTPIEIASELSLHYGHDLDSVAYIPALALIGRMRLSKLTGGDSHLKAVEKVVSQYVDGSKTTFSKRVGGSNLSGHLVFGELARTTGKRQYVKLARAAADLGFDEQGQPKQAMPYHLEMSDAVFMGTPILVQVGRLTGEKKYYDMALRHMRFMLTLNLREDGLHRHSPLDESAWGRGNGFPALGLALSLTDLPENHPARNEMLTAFQSHITALVRNQDVTGMWHQVIDHPESYRELSCTCMITFAIIRGVRKGWLPEEKYQPLIEKAFNAIKSRIASDGTLVDVCTGTGKQKNFRDYLDRKAILGHDPRGGAMALLVTTEMAAWKRHWR